MARLKKPVIKEVSLAINPVNQKKFLFKKEEDMMDEETLNKINKDLDILLGISEEEAEEFEKGASPLKVIEKKVNKLVESKAELDKKDKKTLGSIIDTLVKITEYLKALGEKNGYGYGYPAPKKKDEEEPKPEPEKEEPKVKNEEPKEKKEEVKKDESSEDEEIDLKEIARLVKEVLENE